MFEIPPFDKFFFNGTKECSTSALEQDVIPLLLKKKKRIGFITLFDGNFHSSIKNVNVNNREDATEFYV